MPTTPSSASPSETTEPYTDDGEEHMADTEERKGDRAWERDKKLETKTQHNIETYIDEEFIIKF